MPDFDQATIVRALKNKIRALPTGAESIDIDGDIKAEPNTDPKYAAGYWVSAWIYISKTDVENFGDPTP